MKEDNKKLGDLYKDVFKDLEEQGTGYDWNDMEKKLDRIQFYRLSFTRFNIYYSLLIITCFIASITSATHYFLVAVPRLNKQNTVIITDSVSVPSSGNTLNDPKTTIENRDLNNTMLQDNKKKTDPKSEQNYTQKLRENNAIKSQNSTTKAAPTTNYPQNFLINDGEMEQNSKADGTKANKDSITSANTPIQQLKDTLKTPKEPKTINKTVYITKQDTIFEYDTLKTKKNRKFKK